MGNLTYLAVTILKRDKRTILNAIMMLFCFCGINLIMLLYKICGLAKEFSNAPYIELWAINFQRALVNYSYCMGYP